MAGTRALMLLALSLATPATVSTANVVTDWVAKAVGIVQTGTAPAGTLHEWARKLWNFDRPYRHAGRELSTGTKRGSASVASSAWCRFI